MSTMGDRKKSVVGKTSGPSMKGLMASKRLTSKLTSKLAFGKDRRSSSIATTQVPHIEKEPTYRMEPPKKFNSSEVESVIREVLSTRLERYRYNQKFARNMAKVLGDEIKDRAKGLGYDRYKYVCLVFLGEINDQAMVLCSRCAWDTRNDNTATYTHKTNAYFCTATIYGVYRE